jgi:hypothetical protein
VRIRHIDLLMQAVIAQCSEPWISLKFLPWKKKHFVSFFDDAITRSQERRGAIVFIALMAS